MKAAMAILAIMLSTPTLAHADTAPALKPFIAVYDVTYRGLNAGRLTFELNQQGAGERYTFETRADPSALARLVVSSAAVEHSVLHIGADGVRPLEWRLEDGKSGDKGDGVIEFDWQRGVASGVVKRKRVELPTEPRMQDRSSIQLAVATMLLRGEEPGEIPMIDDERVKRYVYTRKQTEKIDSPIGPTDAIIYESSRPSSSRISRVWLAPQLDYMPVRAEQIRKGKVETVMVMREWKRL